MYTGSRHGLQSSKHTMRATGAPDHAESMLPQAPTATRQGQVRQTKRDVHHGPLLFPFSNAAPRTAAQLPRQTTPGIKCGFCTGAGHDKENCYKKDRVRKEAQKAIKKCRTSRNTAKPRRTNRAATASPSYPAPYDRAKVTKLAASTSIRLAGSPNTHTDVHGRRLGCTRGHWCCPQVLSAADASCRNNCCSGSSPQSFTTTSSTGHSKTTASARSFSGSQSCTTPSARAATWSSAMPRWAGASLLFSAPDSNAAGAVGRAPLNPACNFAPFEPLPQVQVRAVGKHRCSVMLTPSQQVHPLKLNTSRNVHHPCPILRQVE
jgi:hypothetical protein